MFRTTFYFYMDIDRKVYREIKYFKLFNHKISKFPNEKCLIFEQYVFVRGRIFSE